MSDESEEMMRSAQLILELVREGFTPASAVQAVKLNDISKLEHSGLTASTITEPDADRKLAQRLADVLNEVSANSRALVKVDGLSLRGWVIGKWAVWYPGPGLGGWQVKEGSA